VLALTLLGTYLVDFCGADVRRRVDIPQLMVEEAKEGAHARRVIAAYDRMFAGKPELAILRALGYFNRPADPAALRLVRSKIDYRQYQAALKRLHTARLILTRDPAQPLDCHPLVREYFSGDATPEGHAKLYGYYSKQAPYRPESLEEMRPLVFAVYHGCRAGRYEDAIENVYRDRMLRGNEGYLLKKLDAFGTNLSLVADFFETPWTQTVAAIAPSRQSWLFGIAGFALRAVGRLADAVEPMQAAINVSLDLEDWSSVARCYVSLSELHLSVGNVPETVEAAQRAVDFNERGRDEPLGLRLIPRTNLAFALQQSGELSEAGRLFAEAELLHAESNRTHPILYSISGYRYCDLLLIQGQTAEVRRRAYQTLRWAEELRLPLNIGLDHLSLGRAHIPDSAESTHHLDQAVDFLRRAGQLDYLPLALLARGTPQDLAEVFRIATRSGMRLHLTDYHLASARLALLNGDRTQAREHFTKAETLIQETGYHRRDSDLAELRPQCT
jgi:tetratricopeptide (TPR) repeat protein